MPVLATSANVKTVVLSQLTHRPDGDYRPWAEEVKKHFPGQCSSLKTWWNFNRLKSRRRTQSITLRFRPLAEGRAR